ncbi:MAG: hypothetical protein L0Z73_18495 [Gammaproteobacteria bacterium]|nr:hypothetical protein [Gammaproteobacteria bacterium]
MTTRFYIKAIKALLVFCVTSAAYGEQFGIGVQLNTGNAIYLPVKITDTLRIEPYFDATEQDIQQSGLTSGAESYLFGAGIFKAQRKSDNLTLYYGVRLAYVRQEFYFSSSTSVGSDEQDGYQIEPALGFEYFILDSVSVGGEAGYFYQKLEGTSVDSSGTYDMERKFTGTNTNFLLRYYFY